MRKSSLTARERQILAFIGQGKSSKEIAHALGISVWTVGSHRARICTKLGIHTTAELVALSAATVRAARPKLPPVKQDACRLAVDLRAEHGRVQLTYSGRLRQTAGAVTVQIGPRVYYF